MKGRDAQNTGCTKQAKRTKQHDTGATEQRGYHTNRNQKNGRSHIRLPQTAPGKATNGYGKEKSNGQNEKAHKEETPGHGGNQAKSQYINNGGQGSNKTGPNRKVAQAIVA